MAGLKYSVIILNCNRKKYLQRCLRSVLKHSHTSITEFILVDNGSNDGSKEWMLKIAKRYCYISVVVLDKNYGVMYARNQGFKKAKGKFVLTMDNDVEFYGDVLNKLGQELERDKSVGIVGMCGILLPYLNIYIHVHNDTVKATTDVTATTGYCMMLKKQLIDKGLFFDEKLKVIQGEDVDFCLQARSKGFKTAMVPKIPLKHHEHASFELYDKRYEQLMYDNHDYIRSKWNHKEEEYGKGCIRMLFKILRDNNALVFTRCLKDLFFYDVISRRFVKKKVV